MGPRYSRTEDDSASSHSGDKSRRLSLKSMAANVAHKDAWQRRHQGTRSVEGATVVDQDFVEDPIALGPGGDIAVGYVADQDARDERIQLSAADHKDEHRATVAEGAVKPTSVLGVTRVEQKLEVVAHLSDGIPALLDHRQHPRWSSSSTASCALAWAWPSRPRTRPAASRRRPTRPACWPPSASR